MFLRSCTLVIRNWSLEEGFLCLQNTINFQNLCCFQICGDFWIYVWWPCMDRHVLIAHSSKEVVTVKTELSIHLNQNKKKTAETVITHTKIMKMTVLGYLLLS